MIYELDSEAGPCHWQINCHVQLGTRCDLQLRDGDFCIVRGKGMAAGLNVEAVLMWTRSRGHPTRMLYKHELARNLG